MDADSHFPFFEAVTVADPNARLLFNRVVAKWIVMGASNNEEVIADFPDLILLNQLYGFKKKLTGIMNTLLHGYVTPWLCSLQSPQISPHWTMLPSLLKYSRQKGSVTQ